MLSQDLIGRLRLASIPKHHLKVGFMYIELLLVLAIIMFIAFKVFSWYFKKPALDKETQGVISTQGIDTASPKSIVDSTKKKLQDIQSRHKDELDRRGY